MASTEITPESAMFMYLQNYVDLTENFPNDIARLISEIHMIDVKRTKYTKLLDFYKSKYIEKSNNWSDDEKGKILDKIENVLLALERESDSKLEVVRSMLEQIDLKSRQLDASYRLANTLTSNQTNQSNGASASNYSNSNSKSSGYQTSRHHENNSNGRNSPAFHNKDKDHNSQSSNGGAGGSKRMRRGSNKHSNHNNNNNHGDSNNYGSGDDRSSTPVTNQERSNSGTKRGNNKRGLKTGSNKSEKRGKNSSYNNSNNNEDSQVNDDAYDPNEPTYCLCEQVSYGEMICCDNPQCSIEWFHFACVSLTTKPKGRWFCPNCRGDRSNIQRK